MLNMVHGREDNNSAESSLCSSDEDSVEDLRRAHMARLAAGRAQRFAAQLQMADLHAYQCERRSGITTIACSRFAGFIRVNVH